MRVWPGRPYPLGATWDGAGVNFALFIIGMFMSTVFGLLVAPWVFASVLALWWLFASDIRYWLSESHAVSPKDSKES